MQLPINELGYAMRFIKLGHVNSQPSPHVPASAKAVAMDGKAPWELSRGCVLSLRPRIAGVLRVSAGRAWVTLDVSRSSPVTDAGDHFVEPGHDLPLRAGQRLVLESWPAAEFDSIKLVWAPQASPARLAYWQATLVGRSLSRLLLGLAHYASFLAAGRGRVLHRLESNPP